jgi:hypothetical protein
MPVGPATKRACIAILAGLVWGQVSIALALVVVPTYLVYGERVANGAPFLVASWTLLAPLSLARLCAGDSRAALVLAPMIAVAGCLAGACASVRVRCGGPLRWALVLGLVSATVSTALVALQFGDAAAAERAFFALAARAEVPHKNPETVRAARDFVERHPGSRWCSEALRIVAMAEWDAGNVQAASELWRRFELCFDDPLAPGVAYAEFSRALCDERLGWHAGAERHLRAAIGIIRARGDGIQAWIARDAAKHLVDLQLSDGLVATGDYWKTKSMTFSNVYSIQ